MTARARLQRARIWPLLIGVSGVALSIPPLRGLIEQSMVWHMLVQMPLVVLSGGLSERSLANFRPGRTLDKWNRCGLTGFIGAQSILAFWMLPLSIDHAVVLPWFDLLKIASLFACGALLRHSIERSPALIQVFFVGYTVSMMLWLGVYFATTDLRLCNAYSLESQTMAGLGLVVFALTLGVLWLVQVAYKTHAYAHDYKN